VALASIVGRGDATTKDDAIRQAIEDIELEIDNLRGIITDLRPSLLDDLGLLPAIEALLDRRRDGGLDIVSDLALPDPQSGGAGLDPDLETTIYRLLQEALTNVVKHAGATTVHVWIEASESQVIIRVQDDGVGFDRDAQTAGFGLAGMRERVYLAGGVLRLESNGTGTLVSARLPRSRAAASAARSGSYQAAS
jgi:signal transduction histidine kinase